MIGTFDKCKIDSYFGNKTIVNSAKYHQIVQIDVWHEGRLTEQYRKLFTDLKRSLQPAHYRYAVHFHGGFKRQSEKFTFKGHSNPSRKLLRRKTLTGKSCCGSKPVAVAASFSGLVILFL